MTKTAPEFYIAYGEKTYTPDTRVVFSTISLLLMFVFFPLQLIIKHQILSILFSENSLIYMIDFHLLRVADCVVSVTYESHTQHHTSCMDDSLAYQYSVQNVGAIEMDEHIL